MAEGEKNISQCINTIVSLCFLMGSVSFVHNILNVNYMTKKSTAVDNIILTFLFANGTRERDKEVGKKESKLVFQLKIVIEHWRKYTLRPIQQMRGQKSR